MRAKRNRHPFYEPPCTFFNELCFPDSNADILAAYEIFRKRRARYARSGKIKKIVAWRKLVLSRLEYNEISYVDARGAVVMYAGLKDLLITIKTDEPREHMLIPFFAILLSISLQLAAVGKKAYWLITEDSNAHYRHKCADAIRERIIDAEGVKMFLPKAVQSLGKGTRWVREWLLTLSDEDLISLGCAADDALADVDFNELHPSDCDSQIQKMEKYAQSIYPHLQASIKEYSALADRLDMWDANVNESIESLENHEQSSALWVLAKIRSLEFSAEIRGEIGQAAITAHQRHERQTFSSDYCFLFAFSHWFWHIAIYQILARHGAIENQRITGWGKSLLHEVWNHPSKLNRVPVDPAGYKCRTALCKLIAPCVSEIMSCPHENKLRREFGIKNDSCDEIKDISVSLFCSFSVYYGTSDQQAGRLKKVICDLLEAYIYPYADEIMGYLYLCMDADPCDIDVMILEEIAEAAEEIDTEKGLTKLNAAIEAARAKRTVSVGLNIEDDAVAETLIPEEEQAYTWYWVDNTNKPIDKAVSLSWSSFDDESTFSDAVSGAKIKCPIEPEGLLSTLLYYEQMDQHQQVILPSEEFNGRKWHKLRRGNCRLLLREERGKTIVHAYRRKDWVAPGVLR